MTRVLMMTAPKMSFAMKVLCMLIVSRAHVIAATSVKDGTTGNINRVSLCGRMEYMKT